MATIVRLTPEQIDRLFEEAEHIERLFKEMHIELDEAGIPATTMRNFDTLHNRFTSAMSYLERQRQLGAQDNET